MSGSNAVNTYDAIVIGGGHNGLAAGALLAKAGLRTVVLERRPTIGGQVETRTLADGRRAPGTFQTVGRLRPSLVKELELRSHGLSLVAPAVRVFAPQHRGAVTLWADNARTAAELEAWSPDDARAWAAFDRQVRVFGGFLGALAAQTPPDTRSPSFMDALSGLILGRAFRRLDADDARQFLRVLPMAVADHVADWFESEAVRAVVASRGVFHSAMGVLSMGTTALLLADSAGNDGGAAGQTVFSRGGPGAVSDALAAAARRFGAEIRTGAEVIAVLTADGHATGVALASGEELHAPVIASGLDPRRTLVDLLPPTELGPHLRWRAGNIRAPGRTARLNFGLSRLPAFMAAGTGDDAALRIRGRILIGATGLDDMERAHDAAKYGQLPGAPLIEVTIPSLVDPSLVPDGGHVLAATVQYVPAVLADGGWSDAAKAGLENLVVGALEQVAPGFASLVTAREVLTPGDLGVEYGITGGHPYHVESGLESWFAWRPMIGFARYRTPVGGLYLVGPGSHPGGGVTGAPAHNAVREILADRKKR
jgi:phytoene dehydrogenase-like protein